MTQAFGLSHESVQQGGGRKGKGGGKGGRKTQHKSTLQHLERERMRPHGQLAIKGKGGGGIAFLVRDSCHIPESENRIKKKGKGRIRLFLVILAATPEQWQSFVPKWGEGEGEEGRAHTAFPPRGATTRRVLLLPRSTVRGGEGKKMHGFWQDRPASSLSPRKCTDKERGKRKRGTGVRASPFTEERKRGGAGVP